MRYLLIFLYSTFARRQEETLQFQRDGRLNVQRYKEIIPKFIYHIAIQLGSIDMSEPF